MHPKIEESIAGQEVKYEEFNFSTLPLPPSTNELYSTFVRRGAVNRVPSRALNEFKREMDKWAAEHREAIEECSKMVHKWLRLGLFVRMEIDVFFLQERVFTKEGKAKKNDVSNRIKALEDCLCSHLRFDDKNIFEVVARKRTGKVKRCEVRFMPSFI